MKRLLTALPLAALLSGCTVVHVIAIPVKAAGAAVKATGHAAVATVKAAGGLVIPDGKPAEAKKTESGATND